MLLSERVQAAAMHQLEKCVSLDVCVPQALKEKNKLTNVPKSMNALFNLASTELAAQTSSTTMPVPVLKASKDVTVI